MAGRPNRMALSAKHEREVAQRLRAHGWTAEKYGQGLLPEPVKRMLQSKSMAQDRWIADLIAARGEEVILVEAKTTFPNQKRHSFEKSSLSALVEQEKKALLPLFVVFSNWTAIRVSELWEATENSSVCRSGLPSSNGSGTPYWLFDKSFVSNTFDSMFGAQRHFKVAV